MHRKTNLNFEPHDSLARSSSQKALSKPLEAVRNNLADSKSESTSSTQCRVNDRNEKADGKTSDSGEKNYLIAAVKAEPKEHTRCSPSVDLSSNPNVTFVSNTSIPELR